MSISPLFQIQGAILVASLVQVVVGFSGAIGFILRFVGPLAITPTITLIGLSLFPLTQRYAAEHWWIALLYVIFSSVKHLTEVVQFRIENY